MKRYRNTNDPRSIIFVSNSEKWRGTSFNFAHSPKWRWLEVGVVLCMIVCMLCDLHHVARVVTKPTFYVLLFSLCFLRPILMRSLAERELSRYPGPMGPRTSDGLYAAADVFSEAFSRRMVFRSLWIGLAIFFASISASVICTGMPCAKGFLCAMFFAVMLASGFMMVFGFCGLFGCLRCVAKKTDILLLPLWGVLFAMTILAFSPVMDFCSSLTMYGTHPNGKRIAFMVPIAEKKTPRSVKGWKAYRGFYDGNAYVLVGTNANELSALPVGHKGPLSFLSTPLDDDDITILNFTDECMYRAKLLDGDWRVKIGHSFKVLR